jgi:uncharacterized protein (DUF2345 family)
MAESEEKTGEDAAAPDEAAASVETIALAGKHVLEIVRNGEQNVLHLLAPDRSAGLSITITAQGISLRVAGADVVLQTTGKLAIDAEELSLHGRRGVAITTDGDATIRAQGDLSSEARIQNIRARLGNVNVTANDDVKLSGERIKLNT